LTHHSDFAKGLVGLLGNSHAIGEAFQITSDELLTWDQIFHIVATAAGTVAKIVHIPSDLIAKFDPEWGAGLLGDKAHSMIFDNSKIKRTVPGFSATIPFSQGAREIMAWLDANPSWKTVDEKLNATIDSIIARYEAVA
jgi:nucleoside-diphosphate-sugar epimerase